MRFENRGELEVPCYGANYCHGVDYGVRKDIRAGVTDQGGDYKDSFEDDRCGDCGEPGLDVEALVGTA